MIHGREPKACALESAMRVHEQPSLNHRRAAVGGVPECRAVMQEFFAQRRKEKRRKGDA